MPASIRSTRDANEVMLQPLASFFDTFPLYTKLNLWEKRPLVLSGQLFGFPQIKDTLSTENINWFSFTRKRERSTGLANGLN